MNSHTQTKRILDGEMIKRNYFSQVDLIRNLSKRQNKFTNTENFNPLNTFAHRIQEVSDDIKDEWIQNLKNCKNLSSALNELGSIRHNL